MVFLDACSACSSGSHKQSHVLSAMKYVGSPIRISYGPEYNEPSDDFLSHFEQVLQTTIQPRIEENLDDWDIF